MRNTEYGINGSKAVPCIIDNFELAERLGFTKVGEVEEDSPYTFYDWKLIFSKYNLSSKDYFNNKQKTLVRWFYENFIFFRYTRYYK